MSLHPFLKFQLLIPITNHVVIAGCVPPRLKTTVIGPLCHARWITFQSRILRLFMSTVSSEILPKLRKLASYIVNVYFPLHMNIKYKSSVIYGPVNLFKEISLIKEHVSSKRDRNLLLDVLQNNAYFAHPHNMLIAKLGDEIFETRKEAVDLLCCVRDSDVDCLTYFSPKINFDADRYDNMCYMSKEEGIWKFLNCSGEYVPITEPPLVRGLDLSFFLNQPFSTDLPCHTQSVERLVKLTTDVSKAVCGRVYQCAEGMLVIKGREEMKGAA